MVQRYLRKIKLRALLVFSLIHGGLILSVYGLASVPRPEGMEGAHWLLLAGIAGLYGGIVYGVFSIVWPLVILIRTVNRLRDWKSWILVELPRILALIPPAFEAIRQAFGGLARAEAPRAAAGQGAASSGATDAKQSSRPELDDPWEAA
jgi:hypothetical protein